MSRAGSATLFLCGDVMTGRGVDQVLPHSCPPNLYEPFVDSALTYVALAEAKNGPIRRPVDFSYVWGEALHVLDNVQPDARIINLETAVTTSEAADPKGINYRMHPDNMPVFTSAAVDCCVLANNHVIDWGREGLLDTLAALANAGIRGAGAGSDLHEAAIPATIDTSTGRRILVYAFGATDSGIPRSWAADERRPGVHLLDDFSDRSVARIAREVSSSKRSRDIAVASIHWGENWGYEIPTAHRRFAHALIDDADIDIVHGHSSHHPKAIEVRKGRLILYGCGDFLSDYEGIRGYEGYRDDLVLMYFPTLDASSGQLLRLEMMPLQIRNFQLRYTTTEDRKWLRATLDRECKQFGGRVGARDEWLTLES